jgi:hypothetical protein
MGSSTVQTGTGTGTREEKKKMILWVHLLKVGLIQVSV